MVKFIGNVNRLDNKPNKRKSGIARLHRKIVDGTERSEGVLKMAANTKALPVMDVSISGALRMQFMTTTVSKLELLSIFKLSDFDSFLSTKE